MGTPESRWALVPLRSLVVASVVLLVVSCRSAAPRREEPPKAPPKEAMPAWERELREKLSKPVMVEFREATLADACETLSKLADVTIRIDPAVAARATPITLPKCTMPAESALMWICRFARSRYVFRDGAVLVVPPPPPGQLQTRDYDISDLLRPPFRAEGGLLEKGIEKGLEDDMGRGWRRYIRAVVAPETWPEAPKLGGAVQDEYRVACAEDRLVVVHTEAVQGEIARLLDAHRKMRNLQVHVFARLMTVDRAVLDGLKLEWLPCGAGKAGATAASHAPLAKDKADTFFDAVLRRSRGALLSAPRMTCYDAQRVSVQAVINRSYVRTIRSEGEPEIGSVPEGMVVSVQPFIWPDRKSITLIVEEVRRTLPVWGSAAFQAVAGPPTLDAVVTLPDGGSVLFVLSKATTGRHAFKDRSLVAILLTAETVPDIFEE